MTTATRVSPRDRFRKHTLDCPVCGGNADHVHGQGTRCYGHLSDDGRFAFCTREDHAGALPRVGDTYRHFLAGACWCGGEHAGVHTMNARPSDKPARRVLHALIPETLRDGWHETMRFGYHDAGGAFVYFVVRYDPPATSAREPKRFLPYQRVGDDWACDEQGVTRVLYRLPELRAAPLAVPVFIPEGEKCVEALRVHGLVATCSPGGAGKWHTVPGARDELRGKTVIVLSDHDDPGRRHAEQVAADVAGVAASVRVVELPGLAEHGDVANWLDAGAQAVHLLALALTTPEYNAACQPQSLNSTPSRHLEFSPDEVTLMRKRIEHLEAREVWLRELLANQDLSAQHKVAAIVARLRLLDQTWHAEALPVPVYLPALAEACGVKSPQTVSDALRTLADCGAISYHTERGNGPDGQPVTRSYIARQPALATPGALKQSPARKQWGGKRAGAGRPCKACGGTNLIMKSKYVCRDCGTEEHLPDVAVNPAEGNAPEARVPTLYSVEEVQGEQDATGDACSVRGCGGELDAYDARGQPFCRQHAPRREAG